MRSDRPSTLKSQFCCHHLRLPTLCSPLLVSDFFDTVFSLSGRQRAQVSVFVDQEFALMCLRLHQRLRKFVVVLEKLLLGADVLLIALQSPGVVTNGSGFGFFVVGAVGISMNLGNVRASIGSSFAGRKRGRLEDSNVVTTV